MISLSKMKDWFEEETENSVKRVRAEIKKRIDGIEADMQELRTAALEFEVKDTVDAESRSSQNIYEKMTEMVDEFQFPSRVTYKTAEEFAKDLEKFLSRVLTLGQRFIRNLKRKYKTRVFILNRALTRVQKDYQDLQQYLENKTVLLQEVDEASDNIELLIEKVKDRESRKADLNNEMVKVKSIESKITGLNENTKKLTVGTPVEELDDIKKEIQVIVNKLRLEVNGLDKPLRKLQSRAQDGKVMVPPGLIELANLLKVNPEEAFERMNKGHKELNDLLEILIESISKDKLKLKASMQNKAKSISEKIIQGSITDLHNEMIDLVSKRNDIENKIEEAGLKDKIAEVRDEQEKLNKQLDRANRQVKDVQFSIDEINQEIVDLAASTQRKIRKLTNQDVKINIKE